MADTFRVPSIAGDSRSGVVTAALACVSARTMRNTWSSQFQCGSPPILDRHKEPCYNRIQISRLDLLQLEDSLERIAECRMQRIEASALFP
jgi:hypothetical protein